jgi:hypothetical protein
MNRQRYRSSALRKPEQRQERSSRTGIAECDAKLPDCETLSFVLVGAIAIGPVSAALRQN